MGTTEDLLLAFETHSPEGIQAALAAGADPRAPIGGKPPVTQLVEMYMRSPRFAACLRVMLGAGAAIGDPLLEALLLDDVVRLRERLDAAPDSLARRFRLECAYTSLHGVSALHVCAEYNSVACARALLDAGLGVDTPADLDGEGLGGQTPLFHAVNSNQNHCREVMELLVDAGASLDVRLRGLVWGDGFAWETVVFDVTPISYAQCGLFRQFHRREPDVYDNLEFLFRRRHGAPPARRNVPNRYLAAARQAGSLPPAAGRDR